MYRPISDYAIIGDTHTAALISTAGSIDWCCLPHFDSPAVFLRILDDAKGGYCSLEPDHLVSTSRRYLPGTNILETTFQTTTGALCCVDFMPIRKRTGPHPFGQDVTSDHRIIRRLSCTSGAVKVNLTVKPAFSFAAEQARVVPCGKSAVVLKGKNDALQVQVRGRLVPRDGGVCIALSLRQGDSVPVLLSYLKPEQYGAEIDETAAERCLEETRRYWEEWSRTPAYDGPYQDAVLRSALVLKLLTFEPTGAILAAPTTSLPEEIGGVRNWDYRFTWVRDATFTLIALMNLGHEEEAHDFLHFLHRAHSCAAGDFQVFYGIRGERKILEEELSYLDGYRSSRPVRVGNSAATQKQLDVHGELLDCFYLYMKLGALSRFHESFRADLWPMIERVADYVLQHWRQPDRGIWEVRCAERHFVHSKALCWVALDRAVKMARMAGIGGRAGAWQRECDVIHADLLEHGFNPQVGAFVESYGSTALDAAVLRFPKLGVLPASDPRMRSTIEQIERRLMRNGLVYRYREMEDGIPGDEGTFAICTFWLIDNYLMLGRLKDAEDLYRHVLSYANDVGLFAEEIDADTGAQLGNFPQWFTHIALINSSVSLAAAHQGKKSKAHVLLEGEMAGAP